MPMPRLAAVVEVRRIETVVLAQAVNAIGRTVQASVARSAQGSHPCPEGDNYVIARTTDLMADISRCLEHRQPNEQRRCCEQKFRLESPTYQDSNVDGVSRGWHSDTRLKN